ASLSTGAVEGHSSPGRSAPGSSASDSAAVLAKTLAEFVASVARVPALAQAAGDVKRQLGAHVTADAAATLLGHIANAVPEVVASLQSQRADLENFLEQVTRQLAFLERWTSWQQDAAQSRREDNRGLERTFEDEMTGLKRDVQDLSDVAAIKDKVQTRLDAVA